MSFSCTGWSGTLAPMTSDTTEFRTAKCDLKLPELPLDKDASPEKQHLVPFSYASLLFGPDVTADSGPPVQ